MYRKRGDNEGGKVSLAVNDTNLQYQPSDHPNMPLSSDFQHLQGEGCPEFDTIKQTRNYQGNINNSFEISNNDFPDRPSNANRNNANFMDSSVVPYNERFYDVNRVNDPFTRNTADTRL